MILYALAEALLNALFPRSLDIPRFILDEEQQVEFVNRLEQIIKFIPSRYRKALELRYGSQPKTLIKVGRAIGVGKEAARQTILKGLRKLERDPRIIRLAQDFDFLIPLNGKERRQSWERAQKLPRQRIVDLVWAARRKWRIRATFKPSNSR